MSGEELRAALEMARRTLKGCMGVAVDNDEPELDAECIRVIGVIAAALNRAAPSTPEPPRELTLCTDCRHTPPLGGVALHFVPDPTNHHNAAKCSYCSPASLRAAPSTEPALDVDNVCPTCLQVIVREARGGPHPSPGDHDPAPHVAATYGTAASR